MMGGHNKRIAYNAAESTDLGTLLTQAIKGVTKGIAPHRGGAETEEYRRNVPVWLRHKAGLPADEVAQLLADAHPELGIESESDLYDALSRAQLQRRDGTADYAKPAEKPAPTGGNGGFDPHKAREAVQDFAYLMSQLDQTVIDDLRQAWSNAYRVAGHRALARYLVSGDLATACKSFDKMGAVQ